MDNIEGIARLQEQSWHSKIAVVAPEGEVVAGVFDGGGSVAEFNGSYEQW
jgi:hypothetical protein